MTETEIPSYKVNIGHNGVPRVASCDGTWPPAWLAALNSPATARQMPAGLRGWRLPNGVVVCRRCCPRPADAVPVVLADCEDGPQWVEESAPTPCPATASLKAAPLPEPPSKDPQWL